jgi:hypothetical protein
MIVQNLIDQKNRTNWGPPAVLGPVALILTTTELQKEIQGPILTANGVHGNHAVLLADQVWKQE